MSTDTVGTRKKRVRAEYIIDVGPPADLIWEAAKYYNNPAVQVNTRFVAPDGREFMFKRDIIGVFHTGDGKLEIHCKFHWVIEYDPATRKGVIREVD